jgi:hypothetical protein
MKIDTWHAACGKGWHQTGNRTGHCAKCHETFQGLTLFDWHQQIGDDGHVICRDMTGPESAAKGNRLVDGVWHGPAMPAELREKLFGVKP